MVPISVTLLQVSSDPKTRKNQMKYIEAVFLWFFLPYNGWRVIKHNGDEDIEKEHWNIKVFNENCKNIIKEIKQSYI